MSNIRFYIKVGNVHCLRMWGSKVDPYLQLLHFGFCIGAVLSPLIAEPFIDETNATCAYSANLTALNISGLCLLCEFNCAQ